MAKNKKDLVKIVKIIIQPLRQNENTWHIKVERIQGTKREIEETICPKDIFGHAITNYLTLINVFRMLHSSTNPIRKGIETSLKKIKEQETNPEQEEKVIKPSKHTRQEQKQSLQQARHQVNFLTSATDAIRKNLSTEGMLEKVALALALTEVVSIEEIEKSIKKGKRFQIELPITKYPDLSSMQTQHSGQWLSMMDSLLSIGGTIAKYSF